MKNKIILAVALLFATPTLSGQDLYAPVLAQIERNSTSLLSSRAQADALAASYRNGLTPRDPEVRAGYLFGSQATGNRKDISVQQEFDFPTVYAQRNRYADLQAGSAQWQFRCQRMQLLLRAEEICVNLVYENALHRLYEKQTRRARQIAAAYEKMLAKGNTNQLEYNKARLNLTTAETRLATVETERQQLLNELRAMNGGQPIDVTDTTYSEVQLPANFDTWFAHAEQSDPYIQLYNAQAKAAGCNVEVTRRAALPRWSVGYMGEFVKGNNFQGVTLGISIPLWENRNRVNHARQERLAKEQQTDDARLQYRMRAEALFDKIRLLQQTVEVYDQAIDQNNDNLLFTAYEKGALPLINYLVEMDYWTSTLEKRLQAMRDIHLAWAELNAWKL